MNDKSFYVTFTIHPNKEPHVSSEPIHGIIPANSKFEAMTIVAADFKKGGFGDDFTVRFHVCEELQSLDD